MSTVVMPRAENHTVTRPTASNHAATRPAASNHTITRNWPDAWNAGEDESPFVQTGLLADWRLDDGSGQQASDYAGAHHLTLGSTSGVDTNDPPWAAEGLDFLGDDYAQAAYDAALATAAFTLELVVLANGVNQVPFTFGSFAGGASSGLRIATTSSAQWGVQLVKADGTLDGFQVFGAFTAGQWERLTVTYDGTSIRGYLGGVRAFTTAQTFRPSASVGPTFGALWTTSPSAFLNGKIGRGLYYNNALDQAAIDQNGAGFTSVMAGRGVSV